MSDRDPIDDFIDDVEASRMTTVGDVDADPEKAARSYQLSKVTQVPSSVIYGDFEAFEREHKAVLASDIVANNRYISDFIARDPMRAKLAADDYASLDEASEKVLKIGEQGPLARVAEAFKAGIAYDQATEEYGKLGEKLKQAAQWFQDKPVLMPAGAIAAIGAAVPVGTILGVDNVSRLFRAGTYALGQGTAEVAKGLGYGEAESNRLMRDVIHGVDVLSSGALPTGPMQVRTGARMAAQKLDPALKKATEIGAKIEPWLMEGVEPLRGVDAEIDKLKYEQNTADLKNLQETVKDAQQSATRSRDPDQFADFMRQHTDASIGIDGNAVARLYGDKPPAPDDGLLGWVPNLREKIEATAAYGGDIDIPLADWVARVDPEVMKVLQDDIRVRPGNITKNEKQLAAEMDLPERIEPVTHYDTMRDAGGLEPSLMVENRKLTLKRGEYQKPLTETTVDPNFHTFEFMDDTDTPLGYVMVVEQEGGKVLYIEDIASTMGDRGMQAMAFGPRVMRDVLVQLKEQFPNAEVIRGHRVSGARDRAGTWETHGRTEIKLQEEFTGTAYRLMNEFVEGVDRYRLTPDAVAELPKVLTDNQRAIADAITEELNKIVPKQVMHAPAAKIELQGRTVQGLYQPFEEQYPIMLWSLAADDPRWTARHEAIHHLKRYGFFTANEWTQLAQHARDQGWMQKYDIDGRYPTLREGAKVEEAIAEAFGEWRSGKLPAEGALAKLFERLREFLDRVAYRVKEVFGRDLTPEELFTAIEQGIVGSREGNAPFMPGLFKEGAAQQRGKDRLLAGVPQAILDRITPQTDKAGLALTPDEVAALKKGGIFTADDGSISPPDLQRLMDEKALRVQKARPRAKPQRQLDLGLEKPMSERQAFEQAAAIGMTEAQYGRYVDLIARRLDEDMEAITKKAFDDEKKRQGDEWKRNAAGVRAEVVREFDNRPDIGVDEYFANGVLYGEQLKDKNGNPLKPKLDTDLVPPALKEQIPLKYLAKDGVHPDDVAGLFGFPDGAAMMQSLADYNLQRIASTLRHEEFKRSLISNEVERRMEQRFGSLKDNILEQVKDRVLSETQTELLHEEMMALAPPDAQFSINKTQVKEWASDAVSRENLWTVSSDKHLASAGKAGRAAEMALLKGDAAEAFRQKQAQYLAVLAAKEAQVVEKEWGKFERTAKRYSERDVKGVDPEFRDYIQTLLQQAGIQGKRSVPELAEALSFHGYPTFSDFVGTKVREGWEPAVSPTLLSTAPKALDTMTVGEFLEFKAAIDSLNHIGSAVNKIDVAGRAQQFEFFKANVISNITQLPERDMTKAANFFYWADAALVKMEEVIKDLDLRRELGPLYNAIIRPLQESKSREYTMLDKLVKQMQSITGFDKAWQKTLADVIPQTFLVDPISSAPFELTRQNMINIMMNFGNRSNIQKFTLGWTDRQWKGDQAKAAAQQLEMNLKALFDRHATKQDWDYVQHIWDIFEGWKKEAHDLSYEVSGIPPKWLPAEAIQTPHGTYAGGYFPVIYDRVRSGINVIKERPGTEGLFGPNYYRASTPHGYLVERTGHVDYVAFDNTLEQVASRMRQMVHDISHRKAVMDVSKVVYDKEIRAAIRRHYGKEYEAQLSPWLHDVANHLNMDEIANGWANWMMRTARMNLIVHALGFNLRVIGSPSLGTQGPHAPIMGLFADRTLPQSKSLEFKHTMRTMDRDMREQMEASIGQHGWKGYQAEVARWSFWPMLKIEEGLRARTWTQTYTKELRNGASEADAIASADADIRERHGAAGMMDLPAVMRGGEAMKLMTLFYGYFNTVYNWQRQMPGQVKRGEYMQAMGTLYGSVLVPAAFGALFFNQQKQDDSWFKTIGKALLLQPLQTIPFMREAVNYFVEGFPPRTPLESVITAFKAASTDVANYYQGKPVKKGIQHAANVVGMSTGLPLGQVGRTSQFLYDVNTGRQRPRNIQEWARGIINGEAQLKK